MGVCRRVPAWRAEMQGFAGVIVAKTKNAERALRSA
jgi:hypothetical protein